MMAGNVDCGNGYCTTHHKGTKVTFPRKQWLLAHGDDSLDGKCLLHDCGNKGCMNMGHHRPGTRKDNMDDASRDGVLGKRKLTAEKAREIFTRHYVLGDKQAQLAAYYGCTPENIRHVLKRRTWAKATGDLVHLTKPKSAKRRSVQHRGGELAACAT